MSTTVAHADAEQAPPAPGQTYRAAVVHEFHAPLTVDDVPAVALAVGQVREVFELHAAGKTHVIRETRSLDDINEAIADVEAGRVAARIVFELQPTGSACR
jgi:hypothetical protein